MPEPCVICGEYHQVGSRHYAAAVSPPCSPNQRTPCLPPLVSLTAAPLICPHLFYTEQVHQLVLRFAAANVSQSSVSLSFASCSSGASPAAAYRPLTSILYNPLLWQQQDSISAGSDTLIGVGGLQCDVYRNTSASPGSNFTLAFDALKQGSPLHTARLPLCPSLALAACNSSAWSFTLEVRTVAVRACGCSSGRAYPSRQ